jgi:hypothetical protein
VIVVKKLAAKLKIELAAKLGYPLADMLGLKFKILFVIKTDLTHVNHLDSQY